MVMYGANSVIKSYTSYPKCLPLPCHVEHGWTAFDDALPTDLATPKSFMLVYSQRRKAAWEKKSAKPAYIIGCPFTHYRTQNNLKISPKAKGTVVYPSHSTNEMDTVYDIEKFCEELKALPKKYMPVTICLHFIDVNKGLNKIYEKNGFKVVSAGTKHNLDFVRNFYSILKKHKYACSNEVGSYSFYAVDLGVPFFLMGERPVYENKKDENIQGEEDLTYWDAGREATKLFSTGLINNITALQRQYVDSEIGTKDAISSKELHDMLWQNFWKGGYFLLLPFYYLISVFRKLKGVN